MDSIPDHVLIDAQALVQVAHDFQRGVSLTCPPGHALSWARALVCTAAEIQGLEARCEALRVQVAGHFDEMRDAVESVHAGYASPFRSFVTAAGLAGWLLLKWRQGRTGPMTDAEWTSLAEPLVFLLWPNMTEVGRAKLRASREAGTPAAPRRSPSDGGGL